MAKRKEDLAKKLSGGGTTPPGWKSQIAPGGPTEPAKEEAKPSPPSYQRKTYLISPAMVQRIKDTATHYRVGQNELVRFLLGQALDQLETGHLALPLEETYRIKE